MICHTGEVSGKGPAGQDAFIAQLDAQQSGFTRACDAFFNAVMGPPVGAGDGSAGVHVDGPCCGRAPAPDPGP